MAHDSYGSNAEMIAEVAATWPAIFQGQVLDMTYGLGKFWTEFRPADLTENDLDPVKGITGVDWTNDPPYGWIARFDCVVFDPPYKLNGTPDPAKDNRYGVHTRTSSECRLKTIEAGLLFAANVAAPNGTILHKTQDSVVGGCKKWLTIMAHNTMAELGWRLKDQLHCGLGYRPQPSGTEQRHSRQNFSTLQIFVRA